MDIATRVTPDTYGTRIDIKPQYDNFIDGRWQKPADGEYFDNLTPVTGQLLTRNARSKERDIEMALDAAHRAAWAATAPAERARMLLRIADVMEANLERLATAETWDNGKPIREARAADIPLAIDHFRYFASAIRSQEGGLSEIDHDTVAYHFNEPLGVVGQIIPWNFPILMAAWKLAPRWPPATAWCSSRPSRRRWASCCWPSWSPTSCRRACSTSSPASAWKRASRWPPASASPRSPSPARPPPAASSCSTRRRTSSR